MESRGLRHWAYAGDTDRQRLLDALSRAHAQAESPLFHPGDLVWALYQSTDFDPAHAIELWEAEDGELVGFGIFEETDFETQRFVADGEQARVFEAEALSVARERALTTGGDHLSTFIVESDASQRELLEAQGFAVDYERVTRQGEQDTSMLFLRQSLEGAAEEQTAPTGFVVRAVGGEEEWAQRVELHRTVWAPSRRTLEVYRRLRAAPVYRPDLDLVAVAPDGRFASYTIVWYDPASRVGQFEPVGTHPDFRRLGVGQVVMYEGLGRLRALGARRALVMSSAHNPAAIRLYQSVGFEIADRGSYYRASL